MDEATLSGGIADETIGVTWCIVPGKKEMLGGEPGTRTFENRRANAFLSHLTG